MHRYLPASVLGTLSLLVLAVNTIFWSTPFFVVTVAKVVVPLEGWRRRCGRAMARLASMWVTTNNISIRLMHGTQWDIDGLDGLSTEGSYLVNSNHQSWIDVVVLQRTFDRRIPFLRFFLKKELIWLPILGQVWWALDMPFMKRYTKEYLLNHPEHRGRDLETTRRSCERLGDTPVSIINFLEGTRFTPAKQEAHGSPYRHLLKPKAGGMAFVLSAMPGRLRELLDVTIVYPAGRPSLWDFVCGRVPRIVVRVQKREIPDELLLGDYGEDPQYRERFQGWVRELWLTKDALISEVLEQAA